MLASLFLGATAITVLLLLLIFVPYLRARGQAISIFLVVVLAGTMGAFFSSLQRLYDFKELPQILYDKRLVDAHGTLFVYSLVPVLVGGIAAAVIYLVFAGQLLTGNFFPAFDCSKGSTCTDFGTLLADYKPKAAADFAKAILWGFVAGFAERLVPSLLNGFVDKATDAAAKAHASSADDDGAAHDGPQQTAPGPNTSDPKMTSRGLANQDRVSDENI